MKDEVSSLPVRVPPDPQIMHLVMRIRRHLIAAGKAMNDLARQLEEPRLGLFVRPVKTFDLPWDGLVLREEKEEDGHGATGAEDSSRVDDPVHQ